jgi:uncharacterized membrane protein (UPF0127 family)
MPSFFSPLVRNPAGDFHLVNERNGSIVADHLLPAFDSQTRRTGLLAHQSLPAGTAMIIAPTNAIHTFFMKFAIDVLFVAKDGQIVKMREGLRPWRMAAARRGYGVIEMAVGAIKRCNLVPGDRLAIEVKSDTRDADS